MKSRKSMFLIVFLFSLSIFAQKKQLWAKSFLNEKAPELVVEEWISSEPDIKGKFILIDFWATWCGPCIRAIPELNAFHEKFKEDLVVIGISDESKEKINNFKKVKIDYYSAIDTNETLKNIYEVQGIPHCVLIDPDGIVRWEGFPTLKGEELTEKVISEIIAKYK
ncbi:TlpA disulfide reductase family protein [Flavobacterium gelidilacus]|uniref:TlpA family protein disulfide reductase n=1 Tax=Flavobacterium gelidilacus TaxID=206041 RepID=UPI00047AA7CE|nr:TlpA disulfide reductase family protein [Flavobacterium gelidilacus]